MKILRYLKKRKKHVKTLVIEKFIDWQNCCENGHVTGSHLHIQQILSNYQFFIKL